ncbi:MAG: NAD(P)/FAD-dependent oxidoreductase [Elainellaceae cyanobacterium]
MQRRPQVVIIGSGFGGMQAAQSLAGSGANVLLIDRKNYHTFIPLLYQVATAQLDPEHVAFPVRTLLRRFLPRRHQAIQIRFLMANVTRINMQARLIETDRGAIPYDYLVIATGSQPQFLGIPGADDYAFTLKTLNEAIALRNQILTCFEKASSESDPILRQQALTFAIVGGGPTGVEMAGALIEMIRGPMPRDYPTLVPSDVRVIMLQAGDRLLPGLPDQLGDYTCKRLRNVGVQVHLQSKVSRVLPNAVHLQDGHVIPSATVIWAAGVEAEAPETSDRLPTINKGKLVVRSTLQVLEHDQIYAIGDVSYVEQDGVPLAGVAPEALQAGVAVARNIKRQIRGKFPKPFRYFNKGRLAIIGCGSGVGKIGPFMLTGAIAWFMWLAVHVVYLPGFRNRLMVLLSWLQTYVLGDRPSWLIVPNPSTPMPQPQTDSGISRSIHRSSDSATHL